MNSPLKTEHPRKHPELVQNKISLFTHVLWFRTSQLFNSLLPICNSVRSSSEWLLLAQKLRRCIHTHRFFAGFCKQLCTNSHSSNRSNINLFSNCIIRRKRRCRLWLLCMKSRRRRILRLQCRVRSWSRNNFQSALNRCRS
jgi:hypothetical protein